jgi:hypothetical protein
VSRQPTGLRSTLRRYRFRLAIGLLAPIVGL